MSHRLSLDALRTCAGKFGTAVAQFLVDEQRFWPENHGPSIVGMPISNSDYSTYGWVQSAFEALGLMRYMENDDDVWRSVFVVDLPDIQGAVEAQTNETEQLYYELMFCSFNLIQSFAHDRNYRNGDRPFPDFNWNGDLTEFNPSEWFEPHDAFRDLLETATRFGLAERSESLFRWASTFAQSYIEHDMRTRRGRSA